MPHLVSKWRAQPRRAGWGMIRTVGLRANVVSTAQWCLCFQWPSWENWAHWKATFPQCVNVLSQGYEKQQERISTQEDRLSCLLSSFSSWNYLDLLDLSQGSGTLAESNPFLLNVGAWVWQAAPCLEDTQAPVSYKLCGGAQKHPGSKLIMQCSLWVT